VTFITTIALYKDSPEIKQKIALRTLGDIQQK